VMVGDGWLAIALDWFREKDFLVKQSPIDTRLKQNPIRTKQNPI
jgi:hypothetical protein